MRTKTQEKRQAILDVAAATFGELGFERSSMSEICARLGGSKATLYNYFPSKEALFLEVMFQASEADFRNTMDSLQLGDGDIAQTLRTFGCRLLGLLYSPNVVAVRRLLVAEGDRANVGRNCYEHGPRRSHAAVAAFLQQAMNQGLLRTACTALATRQLHSLLESELIARLLFQHEALPQPAEIAQCCDRAVDAFMHLYAPDRAFAPGSNSKK
jgi:AcrR family transcriptional regulator